MSTKKNLLGSEKKRRGERFGRREERSGEGKDIRIFQTKLRTYTLSHCILKTLAKQSSSSRPPKFFSSTTGKEIPKKTRWLGMMKLSVFVLAALSTLAALAAGAGTVQDCSLDSTSTAYKTLVCPEQATESNVDSLCYSTKWAPNGAAKGLVVLMHGYSACPESFNDLANALQAEVRSWHRFPLHPNF